MRCRKHDRPLDKQGYCSECVDTAGAPKKPTRGLCSKCGYSFNLLKSGAISRHYLYSGSERATDPCPGSDKSPRGTRAVLPARPTLCRHVDIGAAMGKNHPVFDAYSLRADCDACRALVAWLTARWNEAS